MMGRICNLLVISIKIKKSELWTVLFDRHKEVSSKNVEKYRQMVTFNSSCSSTELEYISSPGICYIILIDSAMLASHLGN